MQNSDIKFSIIFTSINMFGLTADGFTCFRILW